MDWYGLPVHCHGDGNGHHGMMRAPALPVDDDPRGDQVDSWGGAFPLQCCVPCPDRHVTKDASVGPEGGVSARVLVT